MREKSLTCRLISTFSIPITSMVYAVNNSPIKCRIIKRGKWLVKF